MNTTEIDEISAALIVKGMMTVAAADGDVHPKEVALIEAFEKGLPSIVLKPDACLHPTATNAYLQSLVLVALADGRITHEEDRVIRQLAQQNKLDEQAVDQAIQWAKDYLLAAFEGVTIFKESVKEIEASLNAR